MTYKPNAFSSKSLICSILLGFLSISCNEPIADSYTEPIADLPISSETISTSADMVIRSEALGFIFPNIVKIVTSYLF